MTVTEQLTLWSASASGEILLGITYGDEPCVVQRMKARDALAAFERRRGEAPDRRMQARWERDRPVGVEWRTAEIDVARVAELRGVTCIIVEGRLPNAPHAPYRAVLSSADPFI